MNENIASPPNKLVVGVFSQFPPQIPASKFPAKLVKNQQPISRDKNFLGASFETRDNPIGDKQSSAIVIIKYPITSHIGETLENVAKYPANASIINDIDIKNSAITNFSTEVGSFF